MATKTIITCDLTGRNIKDGDKAEAQTNLSLGKDGNTFTLTITLPEGVDVDRNSLLRAIGATAEKAPRKASTPAPPAEPEAPKGRKGQSEGEQA